jgi:hypothetical protein
VEGGINYFDLAAGHGDSFPIYGEALHEYRDKIFYQIHFGEKVLLLSSVSVQFNLEAFHFIEFLTFVF